jgi:hypothetical protein
VAGADTITQNLAASALRLQPTAALLWFQAPAAGDMGLQFRLYRQTSGNRALLQRVALPQQTLDKVHTAPRAMRSSSLLSWYQHIDSHGLPDAILQQHAPLCRACRTPVFLARTDSGATLQAFAADKEGQWQRVLSPAHSALEKDLVLATLLEQPLQAPGAPDALPAEQACGTDA